MSHIQMAVDAPPLKREFTIDDLPDEILAECFSLTKSYRPRAVCRRWKDVVFNYRKYINAPPRSIRFMIFRPMDSSGSDTHKIEIAFGNTVAVKNSLYITCSQKEILQHVFLLKPTELRIRHFPREEPQVYPPLIAWICGLQSVGVDVDYDSGLLDFVSHLDGVRNLSVFGYRFHNEFAPLTKLIDEVSSSTSNHLIDVKSKFTCDMLIHLIENVLYRKNFLMDLQYRDHAELFEWFLVKGIGYRHHVLDSYGRNHKYFFFYRNTHFAIKLRDW